MGTSPEGSLILWSGYMMIIAAWKQQVYFSIPFTQMIPVFHSIH